MHSVTTIRVSNQIDRGIEVNLNVLRTLFPTFLVPYRSWKIADLSFYTENMHSIHIHLDVALLIHMYICLHSKFYELCFQNRIFYSAF